MTQAARIASCRVARSAALRVVGVAVAAALCLVATPAVAQLARLPRPERVLLIGSSSIHHGFGEAVERALVARGGIEVLNAGRSATGLARLDFFDWTAHSRERIAAFRPNLVIAQFGGNDCQAIIDPDGTVVARFGDPGWDDAYAARVQTVIDDARAAGAGVVFVGMPRMASASFSRRIAHLNGVVERTATAAGVAWVSSWELTSDGDAPRTHITVDGRQHALRDDDGIHLSVRGSAYVADALLAALEQLYDLAPRAGASPP